MKLYLLLLFALFASTTFAFEYFHVIDDTDFKKAIITIDCKTIYVCNIFSVYTIHNNICFKDCIDQNGNLRDGSIDMSETKNPFTECKNSSNYHTANIKISDCRTSNRKGNYDLSFKALPNKVESRSFNYFTANGVHDRVLTGYGWCKYNNNSGRCGGINGLNCRSGQCCSQYNYCGTTSDYCKKGCQSYFGHCN